VTFSPLLFCSRVVVGRFGGRGHAFVPKKKLGTTRCDPGEAGAGQAEHVSESVLDASAPHQSIFVDKDLYSARYFFFFCLGCVAWRGAGRNSGASRPVC
jgi:hypothetical protein